MKKGIIDGVQGGEVTKGRPEGPDHLDYTPLNK